MEQKQTLKRAAAAYGRRSVLKTAASLAIAATAGLRSTAAAAKAPRPVVVELFTSQGCSSCPPADHVLAKLAERQDVIALSMHIDYWDYIGWKDPFASPVITQRQRDYARRFGSRSVYTPQMVVDGLDHVVGSHGMEVMRLIAEAKQRSGTPVDVDLSRNGSGLVAEIGAGSGTADVFCAYYDHHHETRVKRGENANSILVNTNVVRVLNRLGTWTGAATRFALPRPGGGEAGNAGTGRGVAVFVQERPLGPIRGASHMPDLNSV